MRNNTYLSKKENKASIILFIIFILLTSCTSSGAREAATISTSTATEKPTATKTDIPNPEPSATATLKPTTTFTATPELFTIVIQAFHDWNGNGEMDEGEPALEGIINKVGDYECVTDAEGICELGMLPKGNNYIKFDTSNSTVEGLDYVFYDNDVFKSQSEINLILEGETQVEIAFGQGFLPQCPVKDESFKEMWQAFAEYRYDGASSRYYYHSGIDCEIKGEGPQSIYAPVSGFLQPDPNGGWGECNNVNISFRKLGLDLVIGIGHLNEVIVEPNNPVKKGDVLGYINPDLYYPGYIACTSHPHIHFSVWGNISGEAWLEIDGEWKLMPPGEWGWIDPNSFAPAKGKYLPLYYNDNELP